MKRLIAQFGITYFTALSVACFIPDTAVMIAAAVAVVLSVLFILIPKTRRTIFIPAMAIAVLAACLFNLGYSYFYVYPTVEKYADSEHDVVAVIKDEPYRAYKKYYYRLKATEIDGEPAKADILLKSPNSIDAGTDDIISFSSRLEATDNDYYKAKGYYLICDSYDISCKVTEAQSHSLYYHAVRLRQYIRQSFDRLLPESEAALCKAIFVGDKYAMDISDRDSFRYAGASYFIVVSGMHFSILAFLLFKALRRLNRWIVLAVILLFIIVYAAITGFQPSVLRSGVMITFTVIGLTVRRQTYPLNHLGFAGIAAPLFVSPYGAGDLGLILSFYATLAILLWADPISRRICFKDENGKILRFNIKADIKRSADAIKSRLSRKKSNSSPEPVQMGVFFKKLYNAYALILSVGLAANILVFPISVFLLGEFSLVTLLSSVLLYFPIFLILSLSLLVCVLYWLGPLRYLAILLSWPLYYLCLFVEAVVGFLAGLPFSYVRVGSAYIFVWLGATVLLGAAVIALKKRYRLLPYAVLISAAVFLAGWLTNTLTNLDTLALEVYSCGDGIYAGVNDRGRLHLIAMDCRSKAAYEITEKLLYRYGGAETAFCSGKSVLDKYIYYSTDRFAISSFLLYDKDSGGEDAPENAEVFDSDSVFILDDDLTLSASVASGKPVCYLEAGGKRILILPKRFDVSDVPEEWRDPDIIVLREAADDSAGLKCEALIVSSGEENASRIADSIAHTPEEIYYTYTGDVSVDLR